MIKGMDIYLMIINRLNSDVSVEAYAYLNDARSAFIEYTGMDIDIEDLLGDHDIGSDIDDTREEISIKRGIIN